MTRTQPEPPSLPAALLDPRPVILAGALLWVLAVAAAFTVPALHTWRPITLAGLAVGIFGVSLFLWQRSAARRGAPGAQTVLDRHPPTRGEPHGSADTPG